MAYTKRKNSNSSNLEPKKKAIDVVIASILKRIDNEGVLPWENPHFFGRSINWVSKKMYRGINRIILPSGEYLTAKQLNDYNEKHKEDFKFQKGIQWFPVVYYNRKVQAVSVDKLSPEAQERLKTANPDTAIGTLADNDKVMVYKSEKGTPYVVSWVLRYSLVAEIQHFKNSKGETLPRRMGTADSNNVELLITYSEPDKVIRDYISRSGINFEEVNDGRSYYSPERDLVHVNKVYKSVGGRYATIYHELAHSTGHYSRLNRDGISGEVATFGSPRYAVEECIAEITSALLCAETGIMEFETSGMSNFDNHAAYVKSWREVISDWGSKFVTVSREAEKAYFYILGESEESQLGGNAEVEV